MPPSSRRFALTQNDRTGFSYSLALWWLCVSVYLFLELLPIRQNPLLLCSVRISTIHTATAGIVTARSYLSLYVVVCAFAPSPSPHSTARIVPNLRRCYPPKRNQLFASSNCELFTSNFKSNCLIQHFPCDLKRGKWGRLQRAEIFNVLLHAPTLLRGSRGALPTA